MKTMEEFYKEIIVSKELQEELKKTSDEMLDAFLKQHDCNASAKEFAAFMDAQKEGEIEDDDAQAVAGGTGPIRGWSVDHKASVFEVL